MRRGKESPPRIFFLNIAMMDYKIKQKKEDFIVNEISLKPDFCHHKESDFSYLWMEKRGTTTFDAMDEIRRAFNLANGDISAQGLKDEDGLTGQLISVRKIIFLKDCRAFNKKSGSDNYRLQIKKIEGYGKAPLIPRFLHGNNFKLIIRNLKKSTAALFYDYCQKNRFVSFINYYDNQRFGIAGGPYNTHLIGRAVVNMDWVKAFEEFEKSRNSELKNVKKPVKINRSNCQKFFREIGFSKLSFFVSSYNSRLWNKKASDYLAGEKISTHKHDFPGLGPLILPQKEVFKLPNLFTVNAYDIDRKNYKSFQIPFRRNFFVTTTVFPGLIEKDELNRNKYRLEASFFLPTGCYATMLTKQIFIKLNGRICLIKKGSGTF